MATKRPRSGKTVRAPRARKTKTRSVKVEELQTVGADIIPAETIEVTVQAPPTTLFSDWDLHLFNEGTHLRLWEKLGAHIVPGGVMFAVWAPNAERVSVIGDFNDWNYDSQPLHPHAHSASGKDSSRRSARGRSTSTTSSPSRTVIASIKPIR